MKKQPGPRDHGGDGATLHHRHRRAGALVASVFFPACALFLAPMKTQEKCGHTNGRSARHYYEIWFTVVGTKTQVSLVRACIPQHAA